MSKPAKGHPWRMPFEDQRMSWIAQGWEDARARARWATFAQGQESLLPEVARLCQQWAHVMQGRLVRLPADCYNGHTDPLSSNGYSPVVRTLIEMVDPRTAAVLIWADGTHGSDAAVRACVSRAIRDWIEVQL